MISIIIPVYKKLDLTKKCLNSIKKNTKGVFEVIVVDDNSQDETAEYIKGLGWPILIQNKENLGFAKNNNKAAKISKGDILVFLNNDTEVHPGWLEALTEPLTDKKVGEVGAKLLFPDGLVQHAGVVISKDKVPRHIYYRHAADKLYVNKMRDFQIVTAACVAIRKEVFNEIGGFNEAYINGMEDVDLCLRLGEKGLRVVYQPEAVVTHHESVSPGRHLKNRHNADLYMKNWGNKVVSDEAKYYREDGFGLLYSLAMDLKNMAYASDEYGRKPIYVYVLKWIYIPLQKIYMTFSLIFRGNFRLLGNKIKKVVRHES